MMRDGSNQQQAQDRRFMRDALTLGWRQQGLTSPNPAVGSVIVRHTDVGPVIVGRGATQAGGRPHGEPIALAIAGEAARGATLYVTLEPCSHHGRAGPCADAIIAAGIGRVVSSIEDPDLRVAGQGHTRLRAAGIVVDVGTLSMEAHRAHRGHILRVTKGRPALTLKLARTQDGFASGAAGERLLITGEAANNQVHLMRTHADAILVGLGTVLADDPQLTVRLPGLYSRSPIRVVLDSLLRIPPTANLIATAREVPSWIITTHAASKDREALLASAGVEIIRVAADADGRVSLDEALQALAQRGIARIFAEGGPRLADTLAAADLIDEFVILTGATKLNKADTNGVIGTRAIGPILDEALANRAVFRAVECGHWSVDKFERFERFF